jgi:hypothetical protein
MYGFYVERDRGLYCGRILERAERGEYDEVVWGNACAVEARAAALGPRLEPSQALSIRPAE